MDEPKYVDIYKGKSFNKKKLKRNKRVIVFDLDETLGSFIDLEILWQTINLFNTNTDFNQLLDIYPEFLRYGIIYILEYLYSKKKTNEFYKLFIYTNNQSQPQWVQLIKHYFQYKLSIKSNNNYSLFDDIIYAFKINNVRYEINRTTHNKTHNDFINCTLLPKNTSICFLDNTYFSDMMNERIYYIKPMAYFHGLSTQDIIHRFIVSKYGYEFIHKNNINKKMLNDEFVVKCKKSNNFHPTNIITKQFIERNIIISKKMMYHIKEFFLLSSFKSATRKNRALKTRFTMKNSNI